MPDGIMDIGTSVATSIGRYFNVVSFIPSAIYVLLVYVLIASGSWHHAPDWNSAVSSFGHLTIAGIIALVLSSIALGLLIHPIQFAIVQFFEGYWGVGPVPQALRRQRIVHYQKIFRKLNNTIDEADDLQVLWKAA